MRRAFTVGIILGSLCGGASGEPPSDDAVTRLKTCLTLDGRSRQQCLDELLSELKGEEAPPATRSGGSWVVSETTSPVDYSPQINAAILARTTAGGAPSSLNIHCRRQRIGLSITTISGWKVVPTGEVRVAYRIDGRPFVEGRWLASEDGRIATFEGDSLGVLQSLTDGGQIAIRVFDSQGAPNESTFQLDGLDAVRQKIVNACRPPPAERPLSRKRR
jgi:hypothetical protein